MLSTLAEENMYSKFEYSKSIFFIDIDVLIQLSFATKHLVKNEREETTISLAVVYLSHPALAV